MRARILASIVGVLVAACGGGESKSPRETCLDAEATVNAAAKSCNPQFTGHIDLSCQNFGTGTGCDAIDAYFDCVVKTSCDNGTLVVPTSCQLGACN